MISSSKDAASSRRTSSGERRISHRLSVLSSGPCSDPNITTFEFEHAPEPEKPSDSGVLAGPQGKRPRVRGPLTHTKCFVLNNLAGGDKLVSCKDHETFGMGQGPSYTGPFALWARDVKRDVSSDRIRDATITRLFGLWGVFELESGYIRVRTRPR
jgi:hypothetical protein